jgi:hypothetical protein
MSQRFNISTPRKKKDGGTYWVNIGSAWTDEKGTQLVFDALPIPDSEGRCTARLFEPRERTDGGQQSQRSAPADNLADDFVPY